jgi:hypothetical protein
MYSNSVYRFTQFLSHASHADTSRENIPAFVDVGSQVLQQLALGHRRPEQSSCCDFSDSDLLCSSESADDDRVMPQQM